MTVCIAAICDNNTTILGACDRMMTSGDVEFEPDLDSLPTPPNLTEFDLSGHTSNAKIFSLTRAITALTAGDSGLQAEILQEVFFAVGMRLHSEPQRWWGVKEVAELYVEFYNQAKEKRMQAKIFEPYGLDRNTFISRQRELTSDFVAETTMKMQRFEFDFRAEHGVETIFAGFDMSGFNAKTGKTFLIPHIYSVGKSLNGDFFTCCDSVGFAAVGSGVRHAESQFMLAGHTRYSPMPETLLLIYLAKKRSEIAPGVGTGTDMFVIGPPGGVFVMLDKIKDLDMKKIQSIYKSVEKGQKKVFNGAKGKVKKHIDELFEKRRKEQLLQNLSSASSTLHAPPSEQSPPSDEKKEPPP